MLGTSTITRVSPESLLVTVAGSARIRVEGHGRGLLCAGSQKRWVWGPFDETFVVEPPAKGKSITVALIGLGGRAHRDVACAAIVNIKAPTLVTTSPKIVVRAPLPRVRGLVAHRISAPRIVPLTGAAVESACLQTEPTP